MSLLSINGEPIGIKTVIYCPIKQREKGIFFHINLENWRKTSTIDTSKKKRKYQVNFPANENFNLTPLLEKGGWLKLVKALKWEPGYDSPSIVGVEINSKQPVAMVPIECILKLEAFP